MATAVRVVRASGVTGIEEFVERVESVRATSSVRTAWPSSTSKRMITTKTRI